MSGSLFLKTGKEPVGYETPRFPSLSWDFSNNVYTVPMLYFGWDIYRFTVYWCLIFSVGFHMCAAAIACLMHRKIAGTLWIVAAYGFFGAFYGFAAGSLVGLLLGSVYHAGALHMNTWVPFAWALALTLYLVITSYAGISAVL